MSLCDTCPRPGKCCENFYLSPVWWKSEGIGGPLSWIAHWGLPFLPLEPVRTYHDADGTPYQDWAFRCSNLLENGRCGDYENRPTLCRTYQPLTDRLCILHHRNLLPAPNQLTEGQA